MVSIQAKAILLDIEGTTTSISFVKETLFPHALKNAENYLNENWDSDDTKAVVKDLVELSKKDVADAIEEASEIKESDDKSEFATALYKNIEWQMSKDRKSTPLKQLQGMIWKKAYEDGSIKGHIFDDVAKNFESWTANDLKLYIFSSGSVDAQKLLFKYSQEGDLLKHISGHYDTTVGPKQESESYKKIMSELGLKEDEIVFLTDILKEAEAAKSAGLKVVLLDRPGNAEFDEDTKKSYDIVKTFDDIKFSPATSKRKLEDKDVQDVPSKILKQDETDTPAEKQDEIIKKQEGKMDVDSEEKVESQIESTTESKSDNKVECTDKIATKDEPQEKTDQKTEVKTEETKLDKESVPKVAEEKMEIDEVQEKSVEPKSVEVKSTETSDETKSKVEEKQPETTKEPIEKPKDETVSDKVKEVENSNSENNNETKEDVKQQDPEPEKPQESQNKPEPQEDVKKVAIEEKSEKADIVVVEQKVVKPDTESVEKMEVDKSEIPDKTQKETPSETEQVTDQPDAKQKEVPSNESAENNNEEKPIEKESSDTEKTVATEKMEDSIEVEKPKDAAEAEKSDVSKPEDTKKETDVKMDEDKEKTTPKETTSEKKVETKNGSEEKSTETNGTHTNGISQEHKNGLADAKASENVKEVNGNNLTGKTSTSEENETIVAPKETVDPKTDMSELKQKQVATPAPPIEAES